MCVYIHSYTYAYIHTYMHLCMHTYIHTYTYAYIHTDVHLCIRVQTHARHDWIIFFNVGILRGFSLTYNLIFFFSMVSVDVDS